MLPSAKELKMDHDKLKEFSHLSAVITSGIECLLNAQDLLVDLMCKQCDIPVIMKPQIIEDMNKVIGVNKI
jgi:hypothetical protein